MSNVILKAIKDWCNGKFQSKGEYLTAVPEGYVTTEDLKEFHPGGVKLGVDENGNPGYYKYDESAGADTLVLFEGGNGLKIKEWVVTANGGYEYNAESQTYSIVHTDTDRKTLGLSIYVPSPIALSISYDFGNNGTSYYGMGSISLNGTDIVSKTNTGFEGSCGNKSIELIEGANNLIFTSYKPNTSKSMISSFTVPLVGV